MEPEVHVDLVIKTPNLDVGDQYYKCNLNWTVKKLKHYLSDAYPTKPSIENQRLIYFGQVLSDDLILKNVFMNDWKVQTIHMMCPPMKNFSKPTPVSNPHNSNTVVKSENKNFNNPTTGAFQNMQEEFRNPTAYPTSFQGHSFGSVYDNPQITMMQQAYTQYMMQYFQYIQSNRSIIENSSNQLELSSSSPPPQSLVNNTTEIHHEENLGEDVPNIPVNEVNEDPLANRDIIDMTYILIRVAILLSVLYFYSSFKKCLLVIVISFFIYMYRSGFFTFRRERNRNDRRQQIQSRRNVIRNRRSRTRTISETNYNQQGIQNTQVTTVKTFIAAFFTSLIPEQLNPVDIN